MNDFFKTVKIVAVVATTVAAIAAAIAANQSAIEEASQSQK